MSAPELEGRSLLRYLWRQLTSMRNALILLLLLGLASIPGSIFPQRTQSPLKVQEYFKNNPGSAKWMDRFYLFDVYGSPWFSAIYILLFISLIGCVLPRAWNYAKAVSKWREEGFLHESGNLLFHLSLIMILVGIASSSLFGMRGEAIINVGERFINTPTSYDNFNPGRLFNLKNLPPFVITVANFDAKYDPNTKAPEDYTLTVQTSASVDQRPSKRIVKVNAPLTYGDTRIYLQANGYSPLVTVRDKSGAIKFEGPVPFLPQDAALTSIGAIKVPDMSPQIGFVASFLPTAARDKVRGGFSSFPELLDPQLLFSVWKGDLQMDSGIPQSVYRIDTAKMERIGLEALKIGESYEFGEGSITFNGVVPWVNLQIVKDPGKRYALIGSILAIIGLMISLIAPRRGGRVKREGLEV